MSRPLEELQAGYDVVVVGSGYGGGIAASRLARAGRSVCVLERGKEFLIGEFPDTRWEAIREFQIDAPTGHIGSRTGLYDLRANEEISVFMGCGLGGTSLRERQRAASGPTPASSRTRSGRPRSATSGRRPGERVPPSRNHAPAPPYPAEGPTLRKLAALERSAEALGARFYRPPINVRFEDGLNAAGGPPAACNRCGNCWPAATWAPRTRWP